MQEWTTNAIKLDKFEQTTTFSNSSSLFDVLTSIQQQLDFVQNLGWPNRQDKELMREKMYQVSTVAEIALTGTYCNRTFRKCLSNTVKQ